MVTAEQTSTPDTTVERFTQRVFDAVLGAQEVQAIYLGDRLGYYAALAERGALTSTELAAATGSAERYAREWLEHQAVCGYVTVDDAALAATARRYRLPAGHAEVLTDINSLNYLAPLARFVAGSGRQLGAIAEAYRTGGGVSWEQFGEDTREAQAALNRPLFLHALCQELLPAAPEVHRVLTAGARVADIGCGAGWSSVALARAYPGVTVDGFDPDTASIRLAERNAAAYAVADRVTFTDTDAANAADLTDMTDLTDSPDRADRLDGGHGAGRSQGTGTGGYDLVFAFECVHDMPDPVAVLASARRMLAANGSMIIMDERTEEAFHAPAGEVERLLYGFSLTGCLPDGMSHAHSVGTGTVMRPDTLAGYAAQAGFTSTEILPIEHDFFRFYRLVP